MSCYYYFDVSLELEDANTEVTPALFKNHVMHNLTTLFGEIGATFQVDVLKYDDFRAILRIPIDCYVKLHAALTLTGYYEQKPCSFTVHKTGALLLNLCCDSREFSH